MAGYTSPQGILKDIFHLLSYAILDQLRTFLLEHFELVYMPLTYLHKTYNDQT